jgi:hypothetical protein
LIRKIFAQQNHLARRFQMNSVKDSRLVVFHQMKEGMGEWLTYSGNCNSVKKLGLRLIYPSLRLIAVFRDE